MVDAAPLAALVRSFVTDWNRTRPPTAGRFSADGARSTVNPVGAVEWLVQETRAHDRDGKGVGRDTIRNIMEERVAETSFGIADALMTAIDRPEVFSDGTLEVRKASTQRRGLTGTVIPQPPRMRGVT